MDLSPYTNLSFAQPNYLNDPAKLQKEIYQALTPGWLRFGPVAPEIQELIKNHIGEQIKNNSPIKILNAFGGFKNPRVDTAPHIDYAEAFHLVFYLNEVLAKIAAIYEPGIELEYSGDAHVTSIVNNLPRADVDTYLSEFNSLVDHFQKDLPQNIKLSYKHILDFYDYDTLTAELEKRAEETFDNPDSKELIKKYFARAKSNFVVKGISDHSHLSEEELTKLIEKSVIKAYRWYDYDFEVRGDYFTGKIPICNLSEFPETYCTRSVRYMPAPPFWQGKGVLITQGEKTHPAILHVDQFLSQKDDFANQAVERPILDLESLTSIPTLSH